jgi:hypothetical protein
VTPLAISAIAFLFIFGGALAGIGLRILLPDAHLTDNAKDAVRLSTGLIATIAALVLGLLIASAKGSYDTKNTRVKQIAADLILMDNFLSEYGAEALPARQKLRGILGPTLERIWIEEAEGERRLPFEVSPQARAFYDSLLTLKPANDAQRSILARVISISTDLAQARLALYTQAGHSIPTPFLAILVFWLAVIFASFSLFIRVGPVVIAALFICALSATGALFLILEMDRPFSGIMAISDEPLKNALPKLAR